MALLGGADACRKLADADVESAARQERRGRRAYWAGLALFMVFLAWYLREDLISNPWKLLWSLPGFVGAHLLQHLAGALLGHLLAPIFRRLRPYSYTPNYYGDEPGEDFPVPDDQSATGKTAP
ncbi:MAG TPA: hypothetical protein VIT45_14095 [Allosphingosinicella sp.]